VQKQECLWTGYSDLCISGTVCGQDMLTCASVGLFVDRIMLTCESVELLVDRIC